MTSAALRGCRSLLTSHVMADPHRHMSGRATVTRSKRNIRQDRHEAAGLGSAHWRVCIPLGGRSWRVSSARYALPRSCNALGAAWSVQRWQGSWTLVSVIAREGSQAAVSSMTAVHNPVPGVPVCDAPRSTSCIERREPPLRPVLCCAVAVCAACSVDGGLCDCEC